jgi:two-component system phosphate regulon response regulator PhoB
MKRILIVEDQPDIRKLIRMTLEFEDYEIHEASEGAQGLHLARAVRPDIDAAGRDDARRDGRPAGMPAPSRATCRSSPSRSSLLTARGQARDREAGQHGRRRRVPRQALQPAAADRNHRAPARDDLSCQR